MTDVESSEPSEPSWEKIAKEKQSYYYDLLGDRDWEKYPYESINLLKNKLGFILFGKPNISEKSGKDGSGEARENDDETFHENKMKDDNNFIDKLLDDASVNSNDTNLPLITEDTNRLVQFIFGGQDIFIDYNDDAINDSGDSVDSSMMTASTSAVFQNLPSSSLDEKGIDYFYFTDPKEVKKINQLLKQIESCSAPDYTNNGLFVAFIFVVAKIDNFIGDFPVIRVLNQTDKDSADIIYFIDLHGRCYDSWSNFLKENIFPSCIYCYPKDGFYKCGEDENVLLEFGQSPESTVSRQFSKYGDTASSIAGLVCGIVSLGSIVCPIAAPLVIGSAAVGVTSGVWSTGRSIYELRDRTLHNQELNDKEAIGAWLSVATGVFSIASMGAMNYTQNLAKNGRVIGRAANVVVNGVKITDTGLGAVNLAHQAYSMYEEKTFNTGDAISLALSVLFFSHSVMKFQTAKQILIESQNDVINNIEKQLSRRQRKNFKKVVRGTTHNNVMEGNACVIKTVLNLEDPNSYFKDLSKATKYANKTGSTVAFSEDGSGKININGKIEVQPDVINSISDKSKKKIFNSSRKYQQNKKYQKLFKKDIKIVSKKDNLVFKKNTNELLKKMSVKNKHDIKINADKSSNSKVLKNVNGFFNVMKCDKNYANINSRVKSEAKESELNLYLLIRIIFNVCSEFKEGKEKLMQYYEENLKDFFEGLVKDVDEYLMKIFNESHENLRTVQRIFYMKVIDGNDYSPWKYFEIYYQKLWNVVPDSDSVVILRQKAGWLYFLPIDSDVRCVFIAPLRVNENVEKIWLRAFVKNN